MRLQNAVMLMSRLLIHNMSVHRALLGRSPWRMSGPYSSALPEKITTLQTPRSVDRCAAQAQRRVLPGRSWPTWIQEATFAVSRGSAKEAIRSKKTLQGAVDEFKQQIKSVLRKAERTVV